MRTKSAPGLVVALALVVAGSAAKADPPRAVPVSGSPYTAEPRCTSQGTDGEVSLAVDPRTGRAVAAWMQDLEGLGDPGGVPLDTTTVVTASSTDGRTWSQATAPPGVMLCDSLPGLTDLAVDPSVSVGPDGRWYLATLGSVAAPGVPITVGRVFVRTSMDGVTWSPVATPVPDAGDDDFDTVVADPTTPGRAYVTMESFPAPIPGLPPQVGSVVVSRTDDGGTSFGPALPIHQAPVGSVVALSRLVVLPDGTLIDAYAEMPSRQGVPGPITFYATRSRDQGASWSTPVRIADASFADVVDPSTGTPYQQPCCALSLAAGPSGTVALAWTTLTGGSAVHVALADDAGEHWSESTLDRPAPAFEATVAAGRGGLAVTWYELSGSSVQGQARPTTVWLGRSHDDGATWELEPLAGPFDLAGMGLLGGGSLGDFQSLVPVGRGFQAAFTVGPPLAGHGVSDILTARLR